GRSIGRGSLPRGDCISRKRERGENANWHGKATGLFAERRSGDGFFVGSAPRLPPRTELLSAPTKTHHPNSAGITERYRTQRLLPFCCSFALSRYSGPAQATIQSVPHSVLRASAPPRSKKRSGHPVVAGWPLHAAINRGRSLRCRSSPTCHRRLYRSGGHCGASM